jgi:hypothetical protein
MRTDKITSIGDCFTPIDTDEIQNFIRENLNDDWIKLIMANLNDDLIKLITNNHQNTPKKNLVNRKTLFQTHRSLLIRWAVQLNKYSIDSYSNFRSLKQSETPKLQKEHLQFMSNCLFSESVVEIISENNHVGGMHYEHNPPVKIINDKIEKISKESLNDESIKMAFIEEKYCVIIISSGEYEKMNKKHKTKGSFEERLKEAEITKLYKINSEVIQGP